MRILKERTALEALGHILSAIPPAFAYVHAGIEGLWHGKHGMAVMQAW